MTPITAIACDHAGVLLKQTIIQQHPSVSWLDLGTNTPDSVDYPDYGAAVADAIASGKAQRGIVICGSGIGISIAANRNPAVRCALCTDTTMARLSRQHNDANVLALGARVIGAETALDIVGTFLNTAFDGGERHARRVKKLEC